MAIKKQQRRNYASVGISAFTLICSKLCLGGSKALFNPLAPNDPYSGRTAQLTSKRSNLYIYAANTGTEYFKHGIYSAFFLFKMQFVSYF